MIPVLSGVPAFVLVAENSSFREAARALGVTPAAVSRAVARLESELGVRLLHRTSRSVALTPEGARYLVSCREALDRLRAGQDELMAATELPAGEVCVSLPRVFGRPLIDALPRFSARHPRVVLHLELTDRQARLLAERVDLAVRVGKLEDASLVARRLRSPRWVTVASPAWVARHGAPARPDDLRERACLRFARPSGGVAHWAFRPRPGEPPVPFRSPSALVVDDGDLLVHAARAGLGVAQVFDFMVEGALRAGELVELLPALAPPGPPVHAVVVAGRQELPRVRAALDFLVERFGR